ncbi:MAG: hypothetical protein ABWZ99_08505 [Ilumatobacteraceae bacterium]
MNVPVLIFLVVTVLTGIGITYSSGVRAPFEARVGVGIVVGAIVVTAASVAWAYAFGFGTTALGCGVVTAALASAPGWASGASTLGADVRDVRRRLSRPWREHESIRPLAVLTAVSWAVTFRILQLAYQGDGKGGIVAGHLSSYADWSAHLAYLGSFAYGDNVPATLPMAAGSRFTYHAGVDVFAAEAAVLGIPATSALVVTSAVLAMAFPLVFWFAGMRFTGSRAVTIAAYLLFGLSGGLGFVWFFGDLAQDGIGVLTALPRSYSRMTEHDIWVDNWVLSSMYAQRPGLIGLPVVLIVMAIIWPERARVPTAGAASMRPFVAAGLLAGASAGFSVFGFGGAVLFGAWLARRTGRRVAAFIGSALVLGLPMLLLLRPASSNFRWQVGWMSRSLDVPWPWFWLINMGLFLPLGLVALFRPKTLPSGFGSAIAVPAWTIFGVMNLVVLHPWEWNNTHYLVVWALVISFPVAALLVAWARDARLPVRIASGVIAASLVLAGGLDVWEAFEGTGRGGGLTDADGLAAAQWARVSTDPHSVFVVAPVITQPIVSFGARRVVTGFSGWVFDLGVEDWGVRIDDSTTLLRGAEGADDVIDRYGVDYVVLGPSELAEPYLADRSYWDAEGTLVYESPTYRIYATRP